MCALARRTTVTVGLGDPWQAVGLGDPWQAVGRGGGADMTKAATLGALWLGLCLSVPVAAQGVYAFQFQVPDGWRRLSGDYPDPANLPADAINSSDGIPADYVREAMNGTYQFYAVDPIGDWPFTVGATAAGALVGETHQVTQETIEWYISGLAANTSAGTKIKIDEGRLLKLKGIDVAVFSGSVEGPDGRLSTLQYLIPGKTQSAILTYRCAPKDYERYRPVFESAAMATMGAYDHSPRMDWGRTVFVGLLVAGLGFGRMLVIRLRQPKAMEALKAAATASPAGSSSTWECRACQRRVPARVPQCRCGATRPVSSP
jgi:hypothetical protein